MRFVTVRDLRGRPGEIWRELAESGELVITSNGKPIAILTATSEDRLEKSLAAIRGATAVRAVAELQKRAIKMGANRLTSPQIEAEIKASRRGRRA